MKTRKSANLQVSETGEVAVDKREGLFKQLIEEGENDSKLSNKSFVSFNDMQDLEGGVIFFKLDGELFTQHHKGHDYEKYSSSKVYVAEYKDGKHTIKEILEDEEGKPTVNVPTTVRFREVYGEYKHRGWCLYTDYEFKKGGKGSGYHKVGLAWSDSNVFED